MLIGSRRIDKTVNLNLWHQQILFAQFIWDKFLESEYVRRVHLQRKTNE